MVAVDIWIQWGRSPGKTGSHFDPSSDLFVPNERKDVITSTACWAAMLGLLVGLGFVMGPIQLLKLYGVPYVVSFFLFSIISMVLFESRMNEVLIWISWNWRYSLCGWIWWLICTIMAMKTNYLGTVERYPSFFKVFLFLWKWLV